jgi:hypothetical protein
MYISHTLRDTVHKLERYEQGTIKTNTQNHIYNGKHQLTILCAMDTR